MGKCILGLVMAAAGLTIIIMRGKIAKPWFRGIALSMKKWAPGSLGSKIFGIENPDSKGWITFFSCGLVFAGLVLLFAAYTIAFGPIHWNP